MRVGALLLCLVALVGGVLFVGDWLGDRETCFSYDVTAKASLICGTPAHVESEQRRRGREMAQSAVGILADPIGMCLQRAATQAKMNGWPDRYRDAYADGCEQLQTTTGATK